MIINELQLNNYPYATRHGLAERLVRRHFEKKGFEVYRGYQVLGKEHSLNYEKYEPVARRYDRLEEILYRKLYGGLLYLREVIRLTAGVPDFFIHFNGYCAFVEVKMEHESIKKHQYECMRFLEGLGFECIVVRLKRKIYRQKIRVDLRSDHINPKDSLGKHRTVLVVQKKIGKKI